MQAQLYKRIKPTLRKDRIGIYMHVQCSPVMASFLCKNFVWVEFEDIQHCLGFLNIWQIEKKKPSAKGLTKLCCQTPRNIGCSLSACTDQLQGTVFKSSTTEHHHTLCTQITQGMLKYFYQENPECSCDGHR